MVLDIDRRSAARLRRRYGYQLRTGTSAIEALLTEAGARITYLNRADPAHGHAYTDCPSCGATGSLWIDPDREAVSCTAGPAASSAAAAARRRAECMNFGLTTDYGIVSWQDGRYRLTPRSDVSRAVFDRAVRQALAGQVASSLLPGTAERAYVALKKRLPGAVLLHEDGVLDRIAMIAGMIDAELGRRGR